MNRLLLSIALLLLCLSGARAQFGSFSDVPIEISSESTRMESGLAIAEQNVVIRYGETAIYCDYAQYNPDTRDVLVSGNVRIYRDGRLFTAERALYNLETKVLSTADFQGESLPFRFGGESFSNLGGNTYFVKDGLFTTSDSSKPDYYIRAKTVRIYPNDRVVFSDVKLYVGRVPVFWYPYLYQSLTAESGFSYTPGYSSTLGATLLTQFTFPLTEGVTGRGRLDLYSKRGVGIGFDALWGSARRTGTQFSKATETEAQKEARGKQFGESWGRFLSYYIHDADPGVNKTALFREPVDPNRYRVTLQDRTYLTEDIYSTINVNLLSDKYFLQDFEPAEFTKNPNPDNMVNITKWNENYAFTLMARSQLNSDFDVTERLPEGVFEMKRQPFFGTPLFYDSETSAGLYHRNFADGSIFPNYHSFRADTYQQLSYPRTFFGWLSLVPHVGGRATFYENSGFIQEFVTNQQSTTVTVDRNGVPTTTTRNLRTINEELTQGGSLFRAALTASLEASFKLSKAFEGVQSRAWGLDGLRHVVQPYVNASFVQTNQNPNEILQFDRLNRSTQLPPIDFPQFNTIDSLDNWSIIRLGVRNRLQTRRDNQTFSWFDIDTFFDVNLDRPNFGDKGLLSDDGTLSNVFNNIRWNPLPWVGFQLQSQIPLFDEGFWQMNSSLSFLINPSVRLSVGQRYINGNEQFQNSNLFNVGGYFRLNDNWAVSFGESYEFEDGTLENQIYQIHRDLSSWVASFGISVQDNRSSGSSNSVYNIGAILTFTLKDLPNIRIPVSYAPTQQGQ